MPARRLTKDEFEAVAVGSDVRRRSRLSNAVIAQPQLIVGMLKSITRLMVVVMFVVYVVYVEET